MSDLTQKQRKAIQSLVTARTLDEAAKTAGVNPRSLSRWMDDPAFRAELKSIETLALDVATRQLALLSETAVAIIGELMNRPNITPHMKLKAAGMVLANVLKMRELHDLDQRVSRLEEQNDDKAKS